MSLTIERIKKREKIFKEIDTLNNNEKLFLLSHIANTLVKSKVKTSYNLTDLRGLGKDIWEKTDIDDYISKERDLWH